MKSELLPEILAFGYTSDERTLFRDIRKLMPGHHLTLDLAAAGARARRSNSYWDVPAPGHSRNATTDTGSPETRRRLEETVRMHLMSDVPLGMFLSGGVDSSAIAALMQTIGYRTRQDLRGGLPGAAVQRVELRRPSGARHRHGSSRSRNRRWTISSTLCRA